MDDDAALRIAMQAADADQQIALAKYQADSQRSIEAARAGNKAGSDAIKAITLLNGGAAVAMLAFIGHLASSEVQQSVVVSLRPALSLFVVGTFAAVCAAGVTFSGQHCNMKAIHHEFKKASPKADEKTKVGAARKERRWRLAFPIVNGVAIACGLVGLLCFCVACWRAYEAFEKIGTPKGVLAEMRSAVIAAA